jgi:hypothetical protein
MSCRGEILSAGVLVALTFPLLIAVALLIKCESPGPVLATAVAGTAAAGAGELRGSVNSSARLDALPQLINVLRGEMPMRIAPSSIRSLPGCQGARRQHRAGKNPPQSNRRKDCSTLELWDRQSRQYNADDSRPGQDRKRSYNQNGTRAAFCGRCRSQPPKHLIFCKKDPNGMVNAKIRPVF